MHAPNALHDRDHDQNQIPSFRIQVHLMTYITRHQNVMLVGINGKCN